MSGDGNYESKGRVSASERAFCFCLFYFVVIFL